VQRAGQAAVLWRVDRDRQSDRGQSRLAGFGGAFSAFTSRSSVKSMIGKNFSNYPRLLWITLWESCRWRR
jgi:hypothetical protein